MTKTEIEDAIYEWFTGVTSIEAIQANQTDVRPDYPYGLIQIINTKPIGLRDDFTEIDADGNRSLYGHRETVISLQVLGSGANDYLAQAYMSLSKESVIRDLYDNKSISVLRVGTINDLTELQETKFIERAEMEITIGHVDTGTENVGRIEKVEINDETYPIEE